MLCVRLCVYACVCVKLPFKMAVSQLNDFTFIELLVWQTHFGQKFKLPPFGDHMKVFVATPTLSTNASPSVCLYTLDPLFALYPLP